MAVISPQDQRSRGRAPRFPIDSKLTESDDPDLATPVGVTQSLDFDGTSGEFVGNNTLTDLEISTDWTIMQWRKRTGTVSANLHTFRLHNNSNNDGRIIKEVNPGAANYANNLIYDNPYDGTGDYRRAQDNDFWATGNTWIMHTLRFGGGTDLTLVRNATQVTLDTADGSGITTTNASNHSITDVGKGWPGYIHSLAIWSVKLDDNNVTAVYNSGDGTNFDLREDSGNYNQSANLVHWWVFGADTSSDNAMGTNWGSSSYNLMEDASNITTADLVSDSPT